MHTSHREKCKYYIHEMQIAAHVLQFSQPYGQSYRCAPYVRETLFYTSVLCDSSLERESENH